MPRKSLTILLAGLGHMLPTAASANDAPALQTLAAQISIVPLALFLFAVTGAAALFDARQVEAPREPRQWLIGAAFAGLALALVMLATSPGFAAPGAVAIMLIMIGIILYERSGAVTTGPRQRFKALILATAASVFSTAHEGVAALIAPVIGLWAVGVGLEMIRLSRDAPSGSYARGASLLGGVCLVPAAIFLAGFSWIFFGSYFYSGGESIIIDGLRGFHKYQQQYALKHDGRFRPLSPPELDISLTAVDQDPELCKSEAYILADYASGGRSRQCRIEYDEAGRSYAVRVVPVAFYPWPYRLLAPRHAFYMNEDGVIRYETVTGPGLEPGRKSSVYPKTGLPSRW